MDFLEIRRKAKERAEARARAPASAEASVPGAAPPEELPQLDVTGSFVAVADAPPAEAPADEPQPGEHAPAWSEALLPPLETSDRWSVASAEAPGDPEPAAAPPPNEAEQEAAAPTPAPLEAALRAELGQLSAGAWSPPNRPDPLAEFFFDPAETSPGLPDLDLVPAAAPAPLEPAEERVEYLAFRLGTEQYAVEIEQVREILKAPAITEVPRAPAHVLGVIMVRGDVIAVIDPRRRLALPAAGQAPSPRVLVCDAGQGPLGLLVDSVADVVRLRRSDIEPRPQGIGGANAELISGIGRLGDRMFILLDLAEVLLARARGAATSAAGGVP